MKFIVEIEPTQKNYVTHTLRAIGFPLQNGADDTHVYVYCAAADLDLLMKITGIRTVSHEKGE